MSAGWAAALFVASLSIAWAIGYRFGGDYLVRVMTTTRHSGVERLIYRVLGVRPASAQSAGAYTRSVLAFSVVSILALYALQRLQGHFWLGAGRPGV